MFEVNLVGYSDGVCDSFAARYFFHVLKIGGTFTITAPFEDWQEGIDGGTISSVVADPAGPNSTQLIVTITVLPSIPARWWRVWVTVYVKDDEV